jgi:hypothetical protein
MVDKNRAESEDLAVRPLGLEASASTRATE